MPRGKRNSSITAVPDPVSEPKNTVIETPENVTENAPTVIDPAENVMEPKILSIVQDFSWNLAGIKSALNQKIEKYVGLVVTDENLKSMEATQKEIAGLRIKIDSFRKQVKKRLDEPYEKFESEIKELLKTVEGAELPLKAQLIRYEEDRRKQCEADLLEFGRTAAENLGLRPEYLKLTIATQWTNRSAKIGQVKQEIINSIEEMLADQKRDDEAAALKRQKTELIEKLCETTSVSFGLKTSVIPRDIEHLTVKAELADIPLIISKECEKRHRLEIKAAEPPMPPMPPEPVQAINNEQHLVFPPTFGCPNVIDGHPVIPAMPLPPMPTMHPTLLPPIPPMKQPELWNANLHIYAIAVETAEELKKYMNEKGISYNFDGFEKVNP